MSRLLLLLCWLSHADAARFIHSGDATADFGGDAHYRCALVDATGVLQVTWQRLAGGGPVEILGTYSRRFGTQIDGRHAGKVVFSEASLNSTSITVRNVTWADEACYVCSFNAYPGGSTRRQTCLTVQGISDLQTDVQRISNHGFKGDGEVVVSCSATGKPAPEVRWSSSASADLKESNHRTVQNHDGTFTTTSNVTLTPQADRYVDCLVNDGQRRERVLVNNSSMGEEEENTDVEKEEGSGTLVLVIAVVSIMCIACVVVYAWARQKRLLDVNISMCHRRAANVV
ncbi:OX-2 membrane glycoprotein-like [Lampris incognitus]|uniref:OX-2 membrane glycoprotein-like n=1 Tax=Lampris incognitus TaxID=2546036 RepID=UPI0024B5158C|nr:OX-2 membrane glycoprotein-like [Lampris incognitus]